MFFLLLGGPVEVEFFILGVGLFPVLLNERIELGIVKVGENPAKHVVLVRSVLGRGIEVVVLGFEVSVDLGEDTLSFPLQNLGLNFHNHGRVGLTERGLAHQGSVGLVVIIVRVSEGLVDMDIVGDAGNQLGVSSGGSGLEVEVLNGQTFGGFSLVAERLLDVLVVRVDALDDEMALAVGTTDDPGDISVLK